MYDILLNNLKNKLCNICD
jgi:hypothetical protein